MAHDLTTLLRLEDLRSPGGPWLHSLPMTPAIAHELSWFVNAAGVVARVLRGAKMHSNERLFDEIAAALQFPDYFGENWAALDECLVDLSWLQADAYVLVITDATQLLSVEPSVGLGTFMDVLQSAVRSWRTPNHAGSTWEHGVIPFHVVLQERSEAMSALVERLASIELVAAPLNRTASV